MESTSQGSTSLYSSFWSPNICAHTCPSDCPFHKNCLHQRFCIASAFHGAKPVKNRHPPGSSLQLLSMRNSNVILPAYIMINFWYDIGEVHRTQILQCQKISDELQASRRAQSQLWSFIAIYTPWVNFCPLSTVNSPVSCKQQ